MKYLINNSFFKNFDTDDECYILGLLYADGHNNGYNISISLSGDDRYLLDEISSKIYLNNRPLIKESLSIKNKNHQDSYKLFICNKKLCELMENVGMIKNKTYNLKMPSIINDSNKFRSFLRGYFDGDGSIILNKKRITISIVGHQNLLENILFNIELYLNIKIPNKIYNTSSFAKEIKISSRRLVRLLYNYLYTDANIYLKRKKEKFDTYFSKEEYKVDKVKKSKYRWVTYDKSRNKWKSSVWICGKNYNIGRFNTEIDAYNSALKFQLEFKK